MRALRLYAPRDMRVDDVPRPEPGPGEVLIRVRAVGVCGSDVHYYVDGHIGDAVPTFPFTLGHEFSGEIAALGPGVTGPAVGTRVAVDPAVPCGKCEICLEGNPNCCPNVRFPGSAPINGSLSDYYVHPAEACVALPDELGGQPGANARVALAAGGRLGVGNDPTWTNTTCFLTFPFPDPTPEQQGRIPEDLVADEMAESAIAGLEVVDIDEKTGQGRARPPRPREFLLEAGLQIPAVAEAGSGVDKVDLLRLLGPRAQFEVLDQEFLVFPGQRFVVLDEPLEKEVFLVEIQRASASLAVIHDGFVPLPCSSWNSVLPI